MASSVLGSVTLGYQPIWNRQRRCSGVRLFVAPTSPSAVDAHHLLEAISGLWPANAPTLLLHVQSTPLLLGLLQRPALRGIELDVPGGWQNDAPLAEAVRQAQARGWSCKTAHTLSPEQALAALRAARQQRQVGTSGASPAKTSPVLADTLYAELASQELVNHALDQQRAWGVAGWPTDETLLAYRWRQIQPSHAHIRELLKALDRDDPLEALEQRLCEEPLLTYRFLRFANSALVAARTEVASVRQGLMVMGYTQFSRWLAEQLPTASEDINLDPIRASMVLRARIMANLSQAGLEDALRREVFLCGIFSQLDLLLGEPLGTAIHRLPLPGRIASAVVGHTGPYAPWLAVAAALESPNTRMIRDVCQAHGLALDAVNRALLRALAGL
jgi:hypothetical protein